MHTRRGDREDTDTVGHRLLDLRNHLERLLLDPRASQSEWALLLASAADELDQARGGALRGVVRSCVWTAIERARAEWRTKFAVPVTEERFGLQARLANWAADVPDVLEGREARLRSLLADDDALGHGPAAREGGAPRGAQEGSSPPAKRLSAKIRALAIVMREPGITNAALAARIGVHPSTVGRWKEVRRAREVAASAPREGWVRSGNLEAVDAW